MFSTHTTSSVLAVALLSSIAAAQSTPSLTPIPREIQATTLFPIHAISVSVPGNDPEDNFAAKNLEKALTADGLAIASPEAPPDTTITLLRADTPEGAQLLTAANLTFDPPMHDEGYILLARPGHVTIVSQTAAGIFYGAQTLKQLIESTPGTKARPSSSGPPPSATGPP